MRAGLSTIQQTLSPEAAAVVNNSISEAARRRHAQTTPLHVASALLSSPSSRLREACVRSHPSDPSHPLQGSCRALELCFNVALDRLSSSPSASPPPVSNALMAALKRAQASQRRGCPEQLQQPLLAVRVELEQLLLSILDDPSVSRVMREASFSSVSVKAALEQSPVATSLTPPPQANITLHTSVPRLHQPSVARPTNKEEAEKVVEVFSRTKKRNPILVGESGLDSVLQEVLGRVRRNEAGEELRDARVVNLAEETQLGNLIETHLGSQTYVVVNLGNLMSFLEGDGDAAVKVAEIGRALGSGGERVRLIGTANCATYLRLQIKHPTVETDWDLRALPITMEVRPYPRGNSNGILHASSKEIASQIRNESTCKAPPPPLLGKEMCSSRADEELVNVSKPGANLPSWLRSAVPPDGTDVPQTLLKKWKDKCHELHPRVEQPHASLHGPAVSARPDLALGRLMPPPVRSSLDLFNRKGDNGMIADVEGYKSLLKGLKEAVSWQPEAASDVALAVTRCRSGRGGWKSRDDTWLIFVGPDKVGKRRMASTLSDHFCSRMVSVGLGTGEVASRGKTAVDRLAEELRRNPFAVFLLEDVDTADARMQGSLQRAAETGRLTDSRGGEVHLSAAIVVLTSSSLPEGLRSPAAERAFRCEAKLEAAAGKVSRFEVVVGNKRLSPDERFQCGKRRKEEKSNLSLDLNLAVGLPEDVDDEGLTSSDLTWESAKEEQQGKLAVLEVPVAADLPPEWIFNCVDQAVSFRGVDLGALREKMADGLSSRYEELGGGRRLEVEEEVLDCVVGSVWFGFGSEVEQRLEEALVAGVGVGREGSVARLVVARRGLPADVTEESKGWSSGRLDM